MTLLYFSFCSTAIRLICLVSVFDTVGTHNVLKIEKYCIMYTNMMSEIEISIKLKLPNFEVCIYTYIIYLGWAPKNPWNIAFFDSLLYSIVTAFSDAQKGFPWHPTLVDNVFWNIWLATILRFLEKSSKKCYSSRGCKKELYLYDSKTF